MVCKFFWRVWRSNEKRRQHHMFSLSDVFDTRPPPHFTTERLDLLIKPLTIFAYKCKMHIDAKLNSYRTASYRRSYEKGKKIMTDTKASEATRKLMSSVQETSKAIADTAVAAQERNLAFAQNVLENSIEVLKSHAEGTRTLVQELVEQAKKQEVGPEALQAVVDSAIAAQERNTKLAQSILEDGIEVLKSQVGVTRSLTHELGQQYQKQQDAFQALD